MADYVSQAMLAFTPGPPVALVSNASGTLHLPDDVDYTSPVAVQTLDGSMVTTVSSNDSGFIPPLRLPVPVLVWKSGPYTVPIVTVQGSIEAAQAAAAAAAEAADDAAEAVAQAKAATTDVIDFYLGGSAAGLVDVVSGKADLDPETGKVRVEQLPAGMSMSDATSGEKGAVRLSGDLGGTAETPLVPALAGKADKSAVVALSGSQTIAGAKTFTTAPVVPDDAFQIAKVNGLGPALSAKADLVGGKVPTAQLPPSSGVDLASATGVLTSADRLPAGSTIYTSGTTRPTTRTDIRVTFIGADPGANALDIDTWEH